MIESEELLKYVSYEGDQNILKGVTIQDDYMSPLVIFFILNFGPFSFFLGVPYYRLKWNSCIILQSHAKAAASVTHLMEVLTLLFFFLLQYHISNSIKINFK